MLNMYFVVTILKVTINDFEHNLLTYYLLKFNNHVVQFFTLDTSKL